MLRVVLQSVALDAHKRAMPKMWKWKVQERISNHTDCYRCSAPDRSIVRLKRRIQVKVQSVNLRDDAARLENARPKLYLLVY
jgi:hypothetical protein